MITNRKEIKKIIIAVCDRDFDTLEEIQEKEIYEYEELDLTGNDMIDLITYVHRYTAEEYIIRANEQLKNLKNIKDETIREELKKVIYNIVPERNFASFEFNSEEYKDREHYFKN